MSRSVAGIAAVLGLALAAGGALPARSDPLASSARAAGWRSCDWSVTVTAHGRRWKLDRLRTSGVGCYRAKRVARACSATACPADWKHRVDLVAGPPAVWWHSAWTYTISPFAHVQWRARRG